MACGARKAGAQRTSRATPAGTRVQLVTCLSRRAPTRGCVYLRNQTCLTESTVKYTLIMHLLINIVVTIFFYSFIRNSPANFKTNLIRHVNKNEENICTSILTMKRTHASAIDGFRTGTYGVFRSPRGFWFGPGGPGLE